MFNKSNFCHIASNNRNDQKGSVFIYKTSDSLSQVTQSGYFNEKLIDINVHDLIIHVQYDPVARTLKKSLLIVTERTMDNVETAPILDQTIGDDLADLGDQVAGIEEKIPSNASATNQLATESDITNKITNCLTEIPQDIKLELVDGAVVLKAGSKLYVPNGVGVFDEITLQNDLSFTYNVNRTGFLCYSNGRLILTDGLSNCVSGDTDSLAGQTYHTWYDTANNQIKRYVSDGTTPEQTQLSLPLAVARSTVADGFVEIKEIFNGLGYFGSRQFTLPGVKGLYPKGRNADGTLKNGIINCTSVNLSSQFNDTAEKILILQPDGHCGWYSVGSAYYDQNDNYLYNANNGDKLNSAILGTFTTTNGKISNFKPYHTFQAVDYNDFANTKFVTNSTNTLRTLAERFENVINVKEFGAVGDGVTDDTSAISAAMEKANSGDVVFFPNGTYKVSTINIRKRLNLFGGKIVSDSVAITVVTTEKGGSIQSMTLQAPTGISVDGYVRNLVVDNCIIMGATTCGVWVKQGNEFMFKNSLIYLPNDSETTGTGIKVDTWDCHFSNVVIQGYKTAIDVTKGANIFDKIHAWFATDEIFPGSIFMKIQGQNQISNCYSDGYQHAFYLNNDYYSLDIANCLIGFAGHDKTSNTPYAFYFTSGKQDMTVNDTVKNKINCTGIEISGVDTELAYFSNVVGYCIDGYYERNGFLNQNVLNKPNGNSKITNCLTTIPQNLTVSGIGTGTISVAGYSYSASGAKKTTTGVTLDMSSRADGSYLVLSWGFQTLDYCLATESYSGSSQPTPQEQKAIWYDTTNNQVKMTYNGGSTWSGDILLPLAKITISGGIITSIDKIYNGFSEVGTYVFLFPGLSGYQSAGFNTDGSYKNKPYFIKDVTPINISYWNACITIGQQLNNINSFVSSGNFVTVKNRAEMKTIRSGAYYVQDENWVYRWGGAGYNEIAIYGVVGFSTKINSDLIDFKLFTDALCCDKPAEYVGSLSIPSTSYTQMTLGASGTNYTMPNSGYLYIGISAGAPNEYVEFSNITTGTRKMFYAPVSGIDGTVMMAVDAGNIVSVKYSASSTWGFRLYRTKGGKLCS